MPWLGIRLGTRLRGVLVGDKAGDEAMWSLGYISFVESIDSNR